MELYWFGWFVALFICAANNKCMIGQFLLRKFSDNAGNKSISGSGLIRLNKLIAVRSNDVLAGAATQRSNFFVPVSAPRRSMEDYIKRLSVIAPVSSSLAFDKAERLNIVSKKNSKLGADNAQHQMSLHLGEFSKSNLRMKDKQNNNQYDTANSIKDIPKVILSGSLSFFISNGSSLQTTIYFKSKLDPFKIISSADPMTLRGPFYLIKSILSQKNALKFGQRK